MDVAVVVDAGGDRLCGTVESLGISDGLIVVHVEIANHIVVLLGTAWLIPLTVSRDTRADETYDLDGFCCCCCCCHPELVLGVVDALF